ncbi:hypothetical protein [Photorhabdus heterorhabditis]|uniref:Uncharacterized protein n=1 Tax=Photorhabdus heterorhabditis TaxID=880156 RepID=A0A5B0WN48_9GAMM|nr:hypothetical protein [Photorhabdus heterorhabditis]KAA1188017.1 hypothetical protein F0L16_12040 [Photorhabdus heterorhabditis]KOY62269.1 hypothetical protein AM629_09640 [Photorhabdus heterorhabditis]
MKQRLKSLLKKWFPTIHPLPAKRLARWEKEILAVPADIKDAETIKHVEILDYLDNRECHIRNPQRRARSITLIPVTLGIISSLVLNVNDFIESREKNEAWIHSWVDLAKKKYGEKFYLRNDLPDYMEDARYIGNDKDISLRKYLYYRYNFSEYSNDVFITDMTFLLLYLLIIPPFVWTIFFSRRQAPLIIDRERQIFYTWYKGKAYAARYPQLGMGEKTNIFYLKVYGLDENNQLIGRGFIPNVSSYSFAFLSSGNDKGLAVAFMVKFLLNGKEAVSKVDYKRRGPLIWWSKDKRPADLDEQIPLILAELDRLGPPDEDLSE